MNGLSIGRLDYAPVSILMRVQTEHEKGFRLNACAKEPWTVGFIEGMAAGDTFYDLGANVGSYSLLAAKLGHEVVAIEPSAPSYAQLVQNCILNGVLDRVLCVPLPVGAHIGTEWFQYRDLLPGAASHKLGAAAGGKPLWFHQQRMLSLSLDMLIAQFGLPMPTHLKIDVDGGEAGVLQGAAETLKSVQAVMLEMQIPQETELTAIATAGGLKAKGRYAERNGKPIGNICYVWLER